MTRQQLRACSLQHFGVLDRLADLREHPELDGDGHG